MAHPELQGSEGMLHGTAPHRHHIWVFIQPVLGGFKIGFMLPALDAALPARCALLFQRTAGAGRCPVVPHDLAQGRLIRGLRAETRSKDRRARLVLATARAASETDFRYAATSAYQRIGSPCLPCILRSLYGPYARPWRGANQ
jgi:hypothetical protein